MHNIPNLFYFGTTLYLFRAVSPSVIRSLRLYVQHQVYVTQVLWLINYERNSSMTPAGSDIGIYYQML